MSPTREEGRLKLGRYSWGAALALVWVIALVLAVVVPADPVADPLSATDAARRLLPVSGLKVSKVPALLLLAVSIFSGWLLGSNAFRPRNPEANNRGPSALHYVLLAAILAAGAAIRFYGLDFGLPLGFHPDEPNKVRQVLLMDRLGDLNPRRYYHPSFLIYCTFVLSKVLNLFAPLEGQRELVLVAGRAVSAMAGTVSVGLLYLLVRRLKDCGSALIAGALLAFAPVSVTCSRYLKEDSLLVAGVLLTALLWVTSIQRQSRFWFALSGAAAGLAFSAKYTGLVLISLFAVWPWVVSRRWRVDARLLGWSALALCLMGAAFLALTPFALVEPHHAASGFLFEARHAVAGHFTGGYPVLFKISSWSEWWVYHIGRSIIPGMGLLPALLGLVGVGLFLRRRKPEGLIVVGLFLLFLLPAEMARSKPHPQPERYILSVIPFLCIAAAATLRHLWETGSRKLMVGFLVVALGSSVVRSLYLASDLTNDTRTRLATWLPENLPEGSRILMDYASVYSGSLSTPRLRRKYGALVRWRGMHGEGFNYVVESSFGSGRFFEQPNTHVQIQNQLLELRARAELVKEFRAGSGSYGFHNPLLRLYKLP